MSPNLPLFRVEVGLRPTKWERGSPYALYYSFIIILSLPAVVVRLVADGSDTNLNVISRQMKCMASQECN